MRGVNADTMKQTSFWGDSMDWHFPPTKRVGQPRKTCLIETARSLWPKVRVSFGDLEGFAENMVFDAANAEIRNAIKLACDMHMC